MFEYLRTHMRLALGFMLLLIIPAFIFVGVEGYTSSNDANSSAVATVDGYKITRLEWDNAHRRVMDRARSQGSALDPQLLNSAEARQRTLEALVRERVLLAAAIKLHLTPSDARLQRLFSTDPQFAQLRNPDGSVNREILAMQGMSSELFAQQLRQEFASMQVMAGVVRSAVAPASIVGAALDPLLQRRDVQYQFYDPAQYRSKVQPTEAEIEAFYKAQTNEFKAPEQARIEYVELEIDSLVASVNPSEEELQKFYTDNAARFTAPEERRARHILINAASDAAAAEKAKAKEKAEGLLAELRKNPAAFAALARKHSQDTGSAVEGGDLGVFGRGAMVKPFEDQAFALKVDEISDLVETEYGYHIIQLTEAKGGEKRPLATVRAQIEAELKRASAQRRWAETAEQFTNTVYEQSESLQPVIDKLKLQKKTATVQRAPTPDTTGALSSTRLLEAVFGEEVLVNKRNTDAVDLGSSHLISARVLEHIPSRVLPLAEVRDRVLERLISRQARALALNDGKARLNALQTAAVQGEPLPNAGIVSRQLPQGLPKPALDAVLAADAAKLPALLGVEVEGGGYYVVRIRSTLPREPIPGGEGPIREQYAQTWAAAESEAYLAALKRRFKVEIKPAAAAAAGAASAAFGS